jgi:hypothetical protein
MIATGRGFGGYVKNIISAGDGNDQVSVTGWASTFGRGGGGDVANTIDGGKGDDHIVAIAEGFLGMGRNEAFGGAGNDRLEVVFRGEGSTTSAAESSNYLHGGTGDDTLISTVEVDDYKWGNSEDRASRKSRRRRYNGLDARRGMVRVRTSVDLPRIIWR